MLLKLSKSVVIMIIFIVINKWKSKIKNVTGVVVVRNSYLEMPEFGHRPLLKAIVMVS